MISINEFSENEDEEEVKAVTISHTAKSSPMNVLNQENLPAAGLKIEKVETFSDAIQIK